MNTQTDQAIRQYLTTILAQRGDQHSLGDDDSLFLSGRLDSLAMMNLVIYLENTFNIDFSSMNFDVGLIDTSSAISKLVKYSAI